MPRFFRNLAGFAAGATLNLMDDFVFHFEGDLANDPSRQLMPAILGLALVLRGLSKRDSRYTSLGCGLLYAVALRVATGCYNMASYCGEPSPRPASMSM